MLPIATNKLFVYGTLMSRSRSVLGRDQRRRLLRASMHLGTATTPGRLYQIANSPGTAYPGLTDPHAATELVHGEVFAVHDVRKVFSWLDPYEGIAPDAAGDTAGYRRTVRPVVLANGRRLAAWLYLYQGDIAGCHHIEAGRWQPDRASL